MGTAANTLEKASQQKRRTEDMELEVYIDGNWFPKSEAKISVFDHGLLYGDGVFEGIRSYNCLVFKLEEHLSRLYESAHTIMLKIPLDQKKMAAVVVETLRRNRLRDAYIRVVVTRGVGDLGLDPEKCPKPTIIVITDKIVLYPDRLYEGGLEIITVPTVRNHPEAVNPALKSLNYLNNILAKIEATNSGYREALLLNPQGYVAECTGDNIFMVKNGTLLTPPDHVGVLRGITRATILDIARKKKIPAEERILTRHDLYNASEVFLTGTAAEVIPVVKIDGRIIGRGKPGALTRLLTKEFRELTKKEGVRYAL